MDARPILERFPSSGSHVSDVLDRITTALAERYRVEREIGAGGMATVYLAEDVKHQRQVAIKVLRPELAAVMGAERFLREIGIAARLQHPHILPLYDSGEGDGFLYFVMPYVEGESLRERIARHGALPIGDGVRLLRDVADALAYAHSQDVVHRDVKPDNVLLSRNHALVTDFGVAKALSEASGRQEVTTVGVALGTPAYMSPEQASADSQADHRADLYSFGVVAYEVLTGRLPFTGRSAQDILSRHLTQAPERIGTHRSSVPTVLAHVVMRCLEKNPADRWQSADEILPALESLATPSGGMTPTGVPPIVTTEHEARKPMWRRGALVVTAGLVLGGVALGVGLLERDTATAPTLDSNAVAIMPFVVQGSESISYVGEGIVDLLSANLDGAGGFRTVSPHSVRAVVQSADEVASSIEGGASLGRLLGAGRVVTGGIVEVGGQVRLHATLYLTSDPTDGTGEITVEGVADSIFALVDQLARGLLAAQFGTVTSRAARVASRSTNSVAAFKAYLDAESHVQNGEFDAAKVDYQRAVEEDSTFAMAYLRLGMAFAEGLQWEPADSAARAALRHMEGLADRERRLIEAFAADARGDFRDAISRYAAIVRDYPDDVIAWNEYGDNLFHHSWRWGGSLSDSRGALETVLRFEPGNTEPIFHLAQLAIAGRDAAWLDDVIPLIRDSAAYDRRRIQRGWLIADAVDLPALIDSLQTAGSATGAWHDIAFFGGDVVFAHDLLAATNSDSRFARFILPLLDAAQGQWTRADSGAVALAEEFRIQEEMRDYSLPRHMRTLHNPFGTAASALDTLRDRLAATAPTARRARARRLWALGWLSARLGDASSAERYATELARLRPSAEGGSLYEDLAQGVRARAAFQAGQASTALELLEQARFYNREVVPDIYESLAHQRLLRADLLVALGREREALRWYEGLIAPGFNRESIVLRGAALFRRAQAREQLGEHESAMTDYAEFMDQMRDADADLQPIVETAKRAISRLTEER